MAFVASTHCFNQSQIPDMRLSSKVAVITKTRHKIRRTMIAMHTDEHRVFTGISRVIGELAQYKLMMPVTIYCVDRRTKCQSAWGWELEIQLKWRQIHTKDLLFNQCIVSFRKYLYSSVYICSLYMWHTIYMYIYTCMWYIYVLH